jgi:glycosyltransferase involved in cell wall biosynthesis
MRVLMLAPATPYLPTHDRARLVSAYLLAHVAERHRVALVVPEARGETPAQQAWASALAASVVRVPVKRWRQPLTGAAADGVAAFRAAALAAIADFAPEVVHVEGALLAPLAAELPLPVVVNWRESGVRRARDTRRLARSAREWMRAQIDERLDTQWERRWLPAARACIVASEHDRRVMAERTALDRLEVIPPGVDEARYEVRQSPEPARLVFAGNLAWPTHAGAARRLSTRVLPLVRRTVPHADLLVTGATSDVRPGIWSAAVALVPAEASPGIEAAVLEAMALGTPVVASPAALAGLGHVLPGHHVLVADTDEEMAEAAQLILGEPVVAATLAANARQLVERCYTWAALARSYVAVWSRAADAVSAAVAA